MASWIVHLRIAEKLLAAIPDLDPDNFIIGNVAPDSGVPDEKWEHFSPPPEITHFIGDRKRRFPQEDLMFYRKYLQPPNRAGRGALSFLLGYFFHLITDNYWVDQIGRPTRQRFAEQFAADPDFIWEVKRDWYGLDFLYLRDHPDSPVWLLFKGCRYVRDDLDFLPPSAINQRLEYIQTYYETIDNKVLEFLQRPFIYLSAAEMNRFVDETASILLAIYQQVVKSRCETGEAQSALELVESAPQPDV